MVIRYFRYLIHGKNLLPFLSLTFLGMVFCALVLRILVKRFGRKKLCPIVWAVFTVYLAAVLYVTVFSRRQRMYTRLRIVPFSGFSMFDMKHLKVGYGFGHFLLNVLMFMPTGMLLPFLLPRLAGKHSYPFAMLPVGFGLTLAIELAQLLMKNGCFETDDLISNLTGCILGGAVFALLLRGKKEA